jgi:hypothetical protein
LLSRHFVAAAAVGETYYALLKLPPTLRALESELDVVPVADLVAAGTRRALTVTSGVSTQTRVIERRVMPSSNRGYWQGYDFLTDGKAALVLDNPMGSVRADATHVVFPLANGLQAYFTADADGQRIAISPVLGSPPDADGMAHNAASCFSCHQRGLIIFRDALRKLVLDDDDRSYTFAERDAIESLYPENEDMERVLAQDSEAFARALGELGVSIDEREPVADAYFELRTLERFDAAAELFVSPDFLSSKLGQLPPALTPLASATGEVSRSAFAAAYSTALCGLLGKARNRPEACP